MVKNHAIVKELAHTTRRGTSGDIMGAFERISRGILIGGALGAFGYYFGYAQSLFMAVGVGAIAGFFAGMTHTLLDKRRKK